MQPLSIAQILAEIWSIIKENTSAIAMLIFNYEEYRVMRANREKADALLAAQLEANKNENDKKYAGKSDDDIIGEQFGAGPKPTDEQGD